MIAAARMRSRIPRLFQRSSWHFALDRNTVHYLAYQIAAYVILNLGEDVAMAAFMFC
ncbi:hypothetical protein [Rhodoferax sp. GW822-FHT02A01]|uniref:hypothetical protein n=1 Tax=Rhodoferax sp. GW822-FHT02A01 TaxID=3141537 RepID=UPI00315DB600